LPVLLKRGLLAGEHIGLSESWSHRRFAQAAVYSPPEALRDTGGRLKISTARGLCSVGQLIARDDAACWGLPRLFGQSSGKHRGSSAKYCSFALYWQKELPARTVF